MYYIQEIDKPNFIMNIFNIIKIRGDKIILPITNSEISEKKAIKLAKKTKRILEKTNCNKLAISKTIKKQEIYVNNLYSFDFKIIDGKWLIKVLSCQILEYLLSKKNMKKEEAAITILVNDISDIVLENIKQMVQEYKRVNIVTNHIQIFKRLEEQILEQYGIMITVSNNKKKSLSKAKIILNIDFPTEVLNQYNIYEEAIIINLRGNVKINKKRFNGININGYEISFNNLDGLDYDKKNLYEKVDIYEANILKNQPFKNIQEKIKFDKVKIVKLAGNRSDL